MKSILIYLTLWPQRQEQGCFFSYVKLQIDLDFITFLFSNVRILGNPKCTQQDIFNSKYFFMKNFRSEMCCNMSVLFCGGKFIQIFCDFVKLIICILLTMILRSSNIQSCPTKDHKVHHFVRFSVTLTTWQAIRSVESIKTDLRYCWKILFLKLES